MASSAPAGSVLSTFGRRRVSGVPKSSILERHIHVNSALPAAALDANGRPLMHFPGNEVVTSKYSLLSFLPKNLFEQFRRLANIFFLLLIILQTFPEFITVDPIIAALPTIIIVLATALKDGFEDLKRHATDNQVNNRPTYSMPHWKNVNYVSPTAQRRWIPYYWFRKTVLGVAPSDLDMHAGKDNHHQQPPVELHAAASHKPAGRAKPDVAVDIDDPAKVPLRADDDNAGPETMKRRARQRTAGSRSDPDLDPSTSAADAEAEEGAGDPTTFPDPWKCVTWRDLRVGDFVYLRNNEFIPADVVIVSTSEPDGVCYVETKNLDGETNLKVRRGMSETAHVRHPAECRGLQMVVTAEPPNSNMFSFKGAVTLASLGDPGTPAAAAAAAYQDMVRVPLPAKIAVTINGVLLRGCVLRNTAWVIGVIVYTGPETKLRLNSGETPSKRSIIEKLMNPQIVINLLVMATICLVCAIAGIFWSRWAADVRAPFLPMGAAGGYDYAYTAFLAFWSSLIAFQNIVPISLYLTVEIVKTLQAYFIFTDAEMYYEQLDLPCVPKSWNLADDLGQIEYVFSDKTGTLTRNVMEFRRCSINGVVYGAPLASSSPHSARPPGSQYAPPADYTPLSQYGSKAPTFYDATMCQDMDEDTEHARMISEFWRLIGICHTVLVSKPDPAQPYHITYKAQSPDEAALVDTGKDVGFTFIGRHMTEIFLDVMGDEEQYTLLAVLDFNSTRKRMSIVARRPDGAIVLYTKGADSVIFERLSPASDQLVLDVTLKHLEIFADEGLRTLCLAYRILDENEFLAWIDTYNDACSSIEGRDAKIDATAEAIERDLILLGATAIEDRLQEGVPDCIQILRDAGIKVWVLTGDKMETAISIGFSCNLLSKELNLIVVKGSPEDPSAVMTQLREALHTFFLHGTGAGAMAKSKLRGSDDDIDPANVLDEYTEHALVIDGAALKVALEPANKRLLLDLSSRCKVVICCRVSPLQKAQVVTLVRDGLEAVTCAIGDGANDVSMIQAAHIGIGIAGEEGLQAVMASDYAIAQFRYLSRLLLVHGRWSYHRIAELIYNYFYKDVIFVFVIFWFQFYSGFSTQAPYDFTYMLYYNLFFTNWPVMVLGIFDQDLPASLAVGVPKLYQSGIRQTLYTTARFWLYMGDGLYQSLVCFFIPYGVYASSQASWAGGDIPDIYEMGTTMAASAVTSANLYVALNTRTFTWLNHVAIWVASLGVFYGYLGVYFYLDGPITGMYRILWSSPLFWLGTVLSVTLSLLPRYVAKYIKRTFFPTDADIALEYHKFNLDLRTLVPEPVVVEEPPPPPSAHPDRLSVQIPSPRGHSTSFSQSQTGSQLEIVSTPTILAYAAAHLAMSPATAAAVAGATTTEPAATGLETKSSESVATSAAGLPNSSSSVAPTTAAPVANTRRSTSTSIRASAERQASSSGLGVPPPKSASAVAGSTEIRTSSSLLPAGHEEDARDRIRTLRSTGSGGGLSASANAGSGAGAAKPSRHKRSLTTGGVITTTGLTASGTSGGVAPLAMPNRSINQSHVTMMKTMTVQRNRGFSFSTDESGGMRSVLMCEFVTGSTNLGGSTGGGASAGGNGGVLGLSMQAQKIVRERQKSTVSDWELYRPGSPSTPLSAGPPSGRAGRKFALHLQTLPSQSSTINRTASGSPSSPTAPRSAPPLGRTPNAFASPTGTESPTFPAAPAGTPMSPATAAMSALAAHPVATAPAADLVRRTSNAAARAHHGPGHARAMSTSVLAQNHGAAELSAQYGLEVDPLTGRVINVTPPTPTRGALPTRIEIPGLAPSPKSPSPAVAAAAPAVPPTQDAPPSPSPRSPPSAAASRSNHDLPTSPSTASSSNGPSSPSSPTSTAGRGGVRGSAFRQSTSSSRPSSALRHEVRAHPAGEDHAEADEDEEDDGPGSGSAGGGTRMQSAVASSHASFRSAAASAASSLNRSSGGGAGSARASQRSLRIQTSTSGGGVVEASVPISPRSPVESDKPEAAEAEEKEQPTRPPRKAWTEQEQAAADARAKDEAAAAAAAGAPPGRPAM
ncbi:hypothetical protein H9P43_004733 [Blastocladiella emersonii ATCC 22665]|nr:hypothetical protein H9P43_004733 [Blastocladiella emersonii ATCC 22665]